MATPATLVSQVLANFRKRMIKSYGFLFSSFENEQDARTAGQSVYVSSGPGVPTANIGTNVRGIYFREDAPTVDAYIYGTVDGATWFAIDIGPIALASLALPRGNAIRGSATGVGEALDLSTLGQFPLGDGADLAAAQLPASGLLAMPTANTFAGRTLTAPAAGITVADGDGVAGDPTLALADDLAALEALDATAGLLAKTAADTYARRTIVVGSASLTVANGDGQAGNPSLDTAQDIQITASPEFASLLLTGDLVVQGSSILAQLETIELEANWISQNLGYATAVAVTGGRVINYLPTATADATTGAGVVTPGVLGVSDATITTDGAATFALHDIVMISGSDNDGENDGLFEVLSHAANLLTLRGQLTPTVEGFSSGQLVANAGDLGMAITKITVAADRCGTDGRFEAAAGSATGLAYSDYLLASDIGTGVQAYDAMLAALSVLVSAAGNVLHFTGADTPALLDLGGGAAYSVMYRSGAGTVGIGVIQAHAASTSTTPSADDTASGTANVTSSKIRSQQSLGVLPAAGTNYIAQYGAGAAIDDAVGPFTRMVPPRTAQVVLGVGGAATVVYTIDGTDPNGDAIQDIITTGGAGAGTYQGDLAFTTITRFRSDFNPLGTTDFQTGDGFGLATVCTNIDAVGVDGVLEAPSTADPGSGTVVPTSVPNGARVFVVDYRVQPIIADAGHVHAPGNHTHDVTPDAHTIA